MKIKEVIRKVNKRKSEELPTTEIIEFNEPVELSVAGEYIVIKKTSSSYVN